MGARARRRHDHAGLRASEPLRGLPRAALPARVARVRALAADEVPVGGRAHRPSRHPRPQDPPRQARARLGRRRGRARPAVQGRPRRGRRLAARRPPALGRAVARRRPPGRAWPLVGGAPPDARAARADRGARYAVGHPPRPHGRPPPHVRAPPLDQAETPVPGTNVSAEDALDDLLVAGVRAAVLAPEDEVARWFSWPVPAGTVERLVAAGRIAGYSSMSPALVGTKPHASK